MDFGLITQESPAFRHGECQEYSDGNVCNMCITIPAEWIEAENNIDKIIKYASNLVKSASNTGIWWHTPDGHKCELPFKYQLNGGNISKYSGTPPKYPAPKNPTTHIFTDKDTNRVSLKDVLDVIPFYILHLMNYGDIQPKELSWGADYRFSSRRVDIRIYVEDKSVTWKVHHVYIHYLNSNNSTGDKEQRIQNNDITNKLPASKCAAHIKKVGGAYGGCKTIDIRLALKEAARYRNRSYYDMLLLKELSYRRRLKDIIKWRKKFDLYAKILNKLRQTTYDRNQTPEFKKIWETFYYDEWSDIKDIKKSVTELHNLLLDIAPYLVPANLV